MSITRFCVTGLLLVATAVSTRAAGENPAPWRDAVVYWSMSEADAQHVLEPHGDVAWGVEL
ncbi:MAG: hypothetical protein MUF48_24990, partial [Pirellulaceae bacterium]|nr:hypothetical protein [Pirellulaceae bacterium]